MEHYYGRNMNGYKMVLISNYTSDDVENFVKTTQLKRSEKERQNVRKQLENFHINNVKSKVNNNGLYKNGKYKNDFDVDMKDNMDEDENKMELIEKGLQRLCGNDWKYYLKRFKDEEVYDDDLLDLNEKDLAKLIPKIGPRSRVRNWIKGMKNKK